MSFRAVESAQRHSLGDRYLEFLLTRAEVCNWPGPSNSGCPLFILSLAAMRRIPDFRQPPRLLPELLRTARSTLVTGRVFANPTEAVEFDIFGAGAIRNAKPVDSIGFDSISRRSSDEDRPAPS